LRNCSGGADVALLKSRQQTLLSECQCLFEIAVKSLKVVMIAAAVRMAT